MYIDHKVGAVVTRHKLTINYMGGLTAIPRPTTTLPFATTHGVHRAIGKWETFDLK